MGNDNRDPHALRHEIAQLETRLADARFKLAKLAAFIRPGEPVWYEASPQQRFAAVVDGPPSQLGDGSWCVRLRDLGEDYRQYNGNRRTTVPAAATWCLSPREASVPEVLVADAKRYRRLRVIGVAPSSTKQLENRTCLTFTNLDEFVDSDLAIQPSRGEVEEHRQLRESNFSGAVLANTRTALQRIVAAIPNAPLLADDQPVDERFADDVIAKLGIALHGTRIDDRHPMLAAAINNAHAPAQCPVCNWTNTGLMNYGEPGKPRWMCHGCAARAIQAGDKAQNPTAAEKHAADLGSELRLLQIWADDRWHAEVANRPVENVHYRTLDNTWKQVQRKLAEVAARTIDSPQTGRSDSLPGAQVAVSNTDTSDFADAATLSLVELAYRLFEQIPAGLSWSESSQEWRVAMGTWRSRYHALLGAQPPEIKHRFALARSRAGLSLNQAAKLLWNDGTNTGKVLEAIEDGTGASLTREFVEKMAATYQVNIPWLLGETPLRDYTAMAGARGYENVSDHDRDVIAEFAASLPRGAISKKAQDLRDKIRGKVVPPPEQANAELKKLLGEDE